MTFTIPGRLPSLNEVIQADRNPWTSPRGNVIYPGSILRQKALRSIKPHLVVAGVCGFVVPVQIHIRWVERDRRRDYDNVCSSAKFILDALVKTGILRNDSRRYVAQISHTVDQPDKDHPRIEVSVRAIPGAPLVKPPRPRRPRATKRALDPGKWSKRTPESGRRALIQELERAARRGQSRAAFWRKVR